MTPGAAIIGALAIAWSGIALADAPTAPPPPRAPEQRRVLNDLAYVLGEAHALHRLCAGTSDGFWYDRMNRLLAIEQPEPSFRQLLIDRFNAGFIAGGAEFTECSTESRAAGIAAAGRGRELAAALQGDTLPGGRIP